MRDMTRRGRKNLMVRNKAVLLTRDLPQKDRPGEIRVLHNFVRDSIRYVRDVRGVETVQDAEATLRLQAGDCDDKSVLLASMLEALGFRTRFRAVGFKPGHYQHVFPEVLFDGFWLALETTEPVSPGWIPRNIAASMILEN